MTCRFTIQNRKVQSGIQIIAIDLMECTYVEKKKIEIVFKIIGTINQLSSVIRSKVISRNDRNQILLYSRLI